VAFLLREGRLGAFDLNSRFYADDDLMVGAADPFQLLRILHEVVRGGGLEPSSGVNLMLDQCHNIERPPRRCWSTPRPWPQPRRQGMCSAPAPF